VARWGLSAGTGAAVGAGFVPGVSASGDVTMPPERAAAAPRRRGRPAAARRRAPAGLDGRRGRAGRAVAPHL